MLFNPFNNTWKMEESRKKKNKNKKKCNEKVNVRLKKQRWLPRWR